jgi:hypothetical protein
MSRDENPNSLNILPSELVMWSEDDESIPMSGLKMIPSELDVMWWEDHENPDCFEDDSIRAS